MAIVYNNKQIQHAYYGETPIHQIYLGDQLKWADVGYVFGTGLNTFGELGIGNTTATDEFNKAGSIPSWGKVVSGKSHGVLLSSTHELYTVGRNDDGQLGIGTSGDATNVSTPIKVGSASNWVDISSHSSSDSSAALNSLGEIYTWGNNYNGNLGVGDTTRKTVPTKVGIKTDWITVSMGSSNLSAIDSSHLLYYCGYGLTSSLAQLGEDSDWSRIWAGSTYLIAQKSSGHIYGYGTNYSGELGLGSAISITSLTQIGDKTDWVDIAVGDAYTLLVDSTGVLYNCGHGIKTITQLGTKSDWIKVACGRDHYMAVDVAGNVYVWGTGSYGRLGLGDSLDRASPTAVPLSFYPLGISAGEYHSYVLSAF
jgi:alpha-tubulin suppressor-like RCC1 family protein